MNVTTFKKSYWNYFLELEEQLISTKRFVTFDKNNFKSFSIEYLKLFQAVCSEIDVVGKTIAQEFDSGHSKKDLNIKKWGYILQKAFPSIESEVVFFENDIPFQPWRNWKYEEYKNKKGYRSLRLSDGKSTPLWWNSYNKVKHERTTYNENGKTNYSLANLGNLINAMAALFIVETYFISYLNKDKSIDFKPSELFKIQ